MRVTSEACSSLVVRAVREPPLRGENDGDNSKHGENDDAGLLRE